MAKIEYFDDKGLENFFLNRPKENNGIVQKFEDPTSPYNTLLRAYWTPHKLQLQQRVNKHELSDLRVVMNDRLSTFDGPEHLNVEFEIKSYKLKMRLTDVVNAIVEHIKVLLPSAYTLWTMECFFKLSGKNKLLFLWCNDMRVFNTNGIIHMPIFHALLFWSTAETVNWCVCVPSRVLLAYSRDKQASIECKCRIYLSDADATLHSTDPPKIEAFLAPPVNSHVAPKHKYEKKELKREYFKCPCSGFHIDANCDKVKGLFHTSQMKITTYRYMILFHQASAV